MLKKITPEKLLLSTIIVWFLFFWLNSGTYFNLGPVFFPIFTLVLFNGAFLIGSSIVKPEKKIDKIKNIYTNKDKCIVFITFILGVLGVVLRLYQRVYIQDLLEVDNTFESRLKLLEEGSNPGAINVVSAFFFPFAFISLSYATYYIKAIPKIYYVFIFMFGIYPIIDSFFYQGRLIIVLYSLMFLFTIIFKTTLKEKLLDAQVFIKLGKINMFSFPRFLSKKRLIFSVILLLTIFVNFSVAMMSQRYKKYNFEKHLSYIEYHQENLMDPDLKERIKTSDNPYYLMSMYSLNHYMTHGVMEYIKLVNHVEKPFGSFYGQYQFNVYFKALRLLGFPIKSFEELNKKLDRTGVYTTFWGAFYLDFGVLGAFLLIILGYGIKKCYNKALNGNIICILIYSYVAVVILGSFFINLLSGSIIYYLNALILTAFLYKVLPKKIRIGNEN